MKNHQCHVQLSKFELQCCVALCCVIIDMKKVVSTCVGLQVILDSH
jgi:hypothetical protein